MSPRRRRVVSLAPTQTEIIAALGHMEDLLGVTENCDFPEAVASIEKYGSWYAPDLQRVLKASPDLVCTFGKHQQEVAETLRDEGLSVYHGDPSTVADSLRDIEELAELLERREAGAQLLKNLRRRLEKVRAMVENLASPEKPLVLRIMNWQPFITVGPGAFQYDVIELAGGRNVMEDGPAPYFVCDVNTVRSRNPEVIFYCEAFITDALMEDPGWNAVSAVWCHRLHVFDCGLTCRSGPRIVDMVEQLAHALHPPFLTHIS